jgi:hypothetical protein
MLWLSLRVPENILNCIQCDTDIRAITDDQSGDVGPYVLVAA